MCTQVFAHLETQVTMESVSCFLSCCKYCMAFLTVVAIFAKADHMNASSVGSLALTLQTAFQDVVVH